MPWRNYFEWIVIEMYFPGLCMLAEIKARRDGGGCNIIEAAISPRRSHPTPGVEVAMCGLHTGPEMIESHVCKSIYLRWIGEEGWNKGTWEGGKAWWEGRNWTEAATGTRLSHTLTHANALWRYTYVLKIDMLIFWRSSHIWLSQYSVLNIVSALFVRCLWFGCAYYYILIVNRPYRTRKMKDGIFPAIVFISWII